MITERKLRIDMQEVPPKYPCVMSERGGGGGGVSTYFQHKNSYLEGYETYHTGHCKNFKENLQEPPRMCCLHRMGEFFVGWESSSW